MPNTKSSAFTSIDLATLSDVSGGCGGGRRCHGGCGNRQKNVNIINNYNSAPAPVAAAPASSGGNWNVSVSAGYATA